MPIHSYSLHKHSPNGWYTTFITFELIYGAHSTAKWMESNKKKKNQNWKKKNEKKIRQWTNRTMESVRWVGYQVTEAWLFWNYRKEKKKKKKKRQTAVEFRIESVGFENVDKRTIFGELVEYNFASERHPLHHNEFHPTKQSFSAQNPSRYLIRCVIFIWNVWETVWRCRPNLAILLIGWTHTHTHSSWMQFYFVVKIFCHQLCII